MAEPPIPKILGAFGDPPRPAVELFGLVFTQSRRVCSWSSCIASKTGGRLADWAAATEHVRCRQPRRRLRPLVARGGSKDIGEIGVDLVLALGQHDESRLWQGRGTLDVFHDREGKVKAWKQGLWPWLWLAKAPVSYRRGRSTPRSELPSEQRNRGCPRLRQNWKVMMDATSSAVGKGHVVSFDRDFPVSVGITDSAPFSTAYAAMCIEEEGSRRCWEGKERLAREQGHSGGRSSTYGRSGHEREGPRRSAEVGLRQSYAGLRRSARAPHRRREAGATPFLCRRILWWEQAPNDASNGSNLTMGVGTVDSNAKAAINSGTPEWSREIGKAVSSGATVKERDGDRMKASPL
ncbi:hypothetical protein BHM03_00052876 [Ensete ventricosum]|nr:hypothetical protein BHM03_00052876 [Ensete ventricosum]